MDFVDWLPVLMLISLALLLFSGLPVAFILAGLGIVFSLIGVVIGEMPSIALYNIPVRMYRTISNSFIYPAVAMLLFMSVALERSGIARDMLLVLNALLRRVPGGLPIAVTLIGVLLAPAAGLIGASVVTLAMVALPTMLEKGYRTPLAAGSVAAAGTLGVILAAGRDVVLSGGGIPDFNRRYVCSHATARYRARWPLCGVLCPLTALLDRLLHPLNATKAPIGQCSSGSVI